MAVTVISSTTARAEWGKGKCPGSWGRQVGQAIGQAEKSVRSQVPELNRKTEAVAQQARDFVRDVKYGYDRSRR
jgi:hypothetical protein